MSSKANDDGPRDKLAREAARILSEGGHRDFALAKRKAAARLGVSGRADLPSNVEIERALGEYQRTQAPSHHVELVRLLLLGGLAAMKYFEPFRPRLTGAVLRGTASQLRGG